MIFYDQLIQPDNSQPATPIHIVDKNGFDAWLTTQSDTVRVAVRAQKFFGAANDIAILPGDKPGEWSAVAGVADAQQLGVWSLAKAGTCCPKAITVCSQPMPVRRCSAGCWDNIAMTNIEANPM